MFIFTDLVTMLLGPDLIIVSSLNRACNAINIILYVLNILVAIRFFFRRNIRELTCHLIISKTYINKTLKCNKT